MAETRKLQHCAISANISATMCSVQHLREFIRERLTAAAEEIFTQVEKTIISYEEELDAQRRMMGISWKPDIKLHRVGSELQRQSSDLQQPSVSKEEKAPVIQQVRSLASRSSQDQKLVEDQWIGEEQLKPEPALPKHEEIEYPVIYETKEELDCSMLPHEQQPQEHLPTAQDQKDLCSSQDGEQLFQKDGQCRMMGINWKTQIKLHRIGLELQRESSDLQQPSVSNEEKAPAIQQVWSLASRSSQDQKESEHQWTGEEHMEPEPTLLKYEEIEYPLLNVKREELDSSVLQHEQQPTGQDQTDLNSSEEAEQQTVQKQLAALIETSTLQENDMNEAETRTEQVSFSICPVVESKDQEGSSCSMSESQSDTSTKKRSFSCDSCGICYTKQWQLKKHYRTHVSEKTFSCETCGKSFSQISDLKVHKKSHAVARPFSCHSCGKTFTEIIHLYHHRNIYAGEKAFSCESCGKHFSKLSGLKSHKRIHTGKTHS